MTEAPGSPRAARLATPRWFDTRLVLGVLLVLASVLGGARVLAQADAASDVWLAARDLAPGTVLVAEDLRLGRARLHDGAEHYLTGEAPVGYLVVRGVGADELVPAGALDAPGSRSARREVTVPVPAGHLPPDLARAELVDVYVTPSDSAARRAGAAGATRLVLQAVPVARVVREDRLSAGGQDQSVVLSVPPSQVLALVQALSEGVLDLVRVPRDQEPRPLVTVTPTP